MLTTPKKYQVRAGLRPHRKNVLVAGRTLGEGFKALGEALIAAKRECRHGEWLPFLASCEIPERMAQRAMQYIWLLATKSDVSSDLPAPYALLEANAMSRQQPVAGIVDPRPALRVYGFVCNLFVAVDAHLGAVDVDSDIRYRAWARHDGQRAWLDLDAQVDAYLEHAGAVLTRPEADVTNDDIDRLNAEYDEGHDPIQWTVSLS